MARQKKDINWPKLKNTNGDMNSPWFIEFFVTDPLTGKKIRKRISEGFSDINTYEGRMIHADKLIKEYSEKIKNGEFTNDELIEYEDLLLYNSQNRYVSKRRGRLNSTRVLASQFILHKRSEVSKKTLQTYTSKLRLFCDYLKNYDLEDKIINNIDNNRIVEFLKFSAQENELSRLTIDKYQQILYSFFKWVIHYKKIRMENPVLNIPRIGDVKDMSAPALTDSVRNKLQKKIEKNDPQLWLSCCFQYYCAIRPGTELRLMQLKQINYDTRTLTVKNYLAKNSRTETVDIPAQLFEMIEDWNLRRYDQNLYAFGKNGLPGDSPLGKNAMRMRFNKYRDELNISKEVKYYSWKHSGAQELKISGANIYSIQHHLRHKSLTTTEKYFKKRFGGGDKLIRDEFPDI